MYLPKTPEWKTATYRKDVCYKNNQNKISGQSLFRLYEELIQVKERKVNDKSHQLAFHRWNINNQHENFKPD